MTWSLGFGDRSWAFTMSRLAVSSPAAGGEDKGQQRERRAGGGTRGPPPRSKSPMDTFCCAPGISGQLLRQNSPGLAERRSIGGSGKAVSCRASPVTAVA
jgi:hypothetical protein